jgi:hypothetical protein
MQFPVFPSSSRHCLLIGRVFPGNMEDFAKKISLASYVWDEDDGNVVLAVAGAAHPDVRVWWTVEGSLELFSRSGCVKLLLQLKYRVKACSWTEQGDRLVVRLEKQDRGSWGSVLLGDVGASMPSASAREQGLSEAARLLPPFAASPASRRLASWRRFREKVWLPLGYVQKLLHVTDGLDSVLWTLMILLVLLCPYTKVEEVALLRLLVFICFHLFCC